MATAATIYVNNASDFPVPGLCNLRQAIVSHNENTSPFGSSCATGQSSDLIVLDLPFGVRTIDLGSPLNPIQSGEVFITGITGGCYYLRQAAYLTVRQGAHLHLLGVGIVVNGAEFKSPIDNDGGEVDIGPSNTTAPACNFSNQNGVERKTTLGGVLNNRNGGITDIDSANFINSSAGDNGGAIYIDSGHVTIRGGSFSGNTAPHGGAIFVNRGAILNITSSNFTINDNRANFEGGAIYNNGGKVFFERNLEAVLNSVSIASNQARRGGAIYDIGGQLSIDGMQFLSNSTTESGGAIQVSEFNSQNPASVTRTYFRDNSVGGVGASIYATGRSTLNVSGDTFLRNKGGIYIDDLSNLNVINSTFLGSTPVPESVTVASGIGKVTFATIILAKLNSPTSGLFLSNSLLLQDTCSGAGDDSDNLQQHSTGCPGLPETNLGLSSAFLADNGGPTPTIALVEGSPAVGIVSTADCVDLSGKPVQVDQRGFGRPDSTDPGVCDSGAFELNAVAVGAGVGGIPPGTTF
jgi:predicted outer membrane repeat protein